MYNCISILLLILPLLTTAQDSLRLAPPQTPSERLFAGPGKKVLFEFRMTGAVIRYTVNGTGPAEQSALYEAPLPANSPQIIKACSFSAGFLPSAAKTVQVFPAGLPVDSIQAGTPSPLYRPGGGGILHDGILGGQNLHQHWMGYNQPVFSITIYPGRKKKIRTIGISVLRQQASWIFLPGKITVLDENNRLVTVHEITDAEQPAADEFVMLRVRVPVKKYRRLTIKTEAIPALPAWHAGKGSKGWIFVDELVLW